LAAPFHLSPIMHAPRSRTRDRLTTGTVIGPLARDIGRGRKYQTALGTGVATLDKVVSIL
jgi:hypothetical protein